MKKFAGFTPQQQYILLKKQGYNGPLNKAAMDKFLAASPSAASKMGEYTQIAQQRLAGKPMQTQAMAVGGLAQTAEKLLGTQTFRAPDAGQTMVDPNRVATTTQTANPFKTLQESAEDYFSRLSGVETKGTVTSGSSPRPTRRGETPNAEPAVTPLEEQIKADPEAFLKSTQDQIKTDTIRLSEAQKKLEDLDKSRPSREKDKLQAEVDQIAKGIEDARRKATLAQQFVTSPTQELIQSSISDPMSVITQQEVAKIPEAEGTIIPEGAGQAGAASTAGVTTIGGAAQAEAPRTTSASTFDATTVSGRTPTATAAQGEISEESQTTAETLDPNQLQQLGVAGPEAVQATQVQTPAERKLQEGEILSGSAVDMSKVNEALDVQAAQADPSKMATVQGQLEGLMQQFEGGETPAWAAGAMRQATAALAARGLGASSLAGQAVIQATMESALPIAMADAQTRASFESQNLSNRQQTALFAAEQRAKFLGMEFDQNFQTRVLNAAKVADIANLNFTSEVQVALENAKLTQTADLANLDVRKAKMLSDMAAMTQVDLANLNNRQQAAVQNAQAFLQMDLTNLNNEQQTTIFNTQSRVNALLSDQAAQNAAKQFNASSENQTNQFFAELSSQVSRFNAEQTNVIKQFNAGEKNAAERFNAQVKNARDEFNANNSLVIAQANAVWRQNIATLDTAAQNEANAAAAKAATGMTQTTIDQLWQRERDIMNAALTTAEGDANRNLSLLIADKEIDAAKSAASTRESIADTAAKYQLIGNLWDGFVRG